MLPWNYENYQALAMYWGIVMPWTKEPHVFECVEEDHLLGDLQICAHCGHWDWNVIHEQHQLMWFDVVDASN